MFEAGYEGGRVEEATSEEEVGVGEVRRVWREEEKKGIVGKVFEG